MGILIKTRIVFPNWLGSFMKPRGWGIILIICLDLIGPITESVANDKIEHQVKTAFIYNFIAYTRWPEENVDKPLKLCMYGHNNFGEEINRLTGRSVNKQRIQVQHIFNTMNLQGCQVVFLSESVRSEWAGILSQLKDRPILTLTDSQSTASQPVAINMLLEKEKVIFNINLGAANDSGLNISSKLLKLAKQVYQ